MQIKLFSLPAFPGNECTEEINRFLRSNKILEIKKEFVNGESGQYWAFCVTYLPVAPVNTAQTSFAGEKKEKKDYRSMLSELEFERFSLLRKIRKQISEDDAVPPYAVFTDAELVEFAQLTSLTSATMQKVIGVGKKKMEKYGDLMCSLFNEMYEVDLNEKAGEFEGKNC